MNEDEYYGEFGGFDLLKELMTIINGIEERKDPTYEATMRRSVPATTKAHSTKPAEIRKVVGAWLKANQDVALADLFNLCEALWSTGWREERLAAVMLIGRNERALDVVEWERLRTWASDADNGELIDQLAEITSHLLMMQPRLIGRVEQMAGAYNPWQRRFALATLTIAGRDFAWEAALQRMVERLKDDDEPAVKRALTVAKREIAQRGG